jgi:hypothetical protein
MSNLTNNSHAAALSPAMLAALHDAWRRAGGDLAALDAAITALPPTVGRRGWPLRWARAARAALASAERAARAQRAEEYWAAEAARNAAPVWGVVRQYGVGHFSNSYGYEVRLGAGQMTRPEADEAASTAYKNDKVAQDHKAFWNAFMGG